MAAAKVKQEYEFGGPLGAAAIVCGLPTLLTFFALACNDVSGCPAPSLLDPKTLTWAKFKAETPWPEDGLGGLLPGHVCAWVAAYYALSLVLWRVLPAQEVYGTKLVQHGKPLLYRFNAFSSAVVQIAACGVGTYFHGANFVVWRYIADNYLQLLIANILLSTIISVVVYITSFTVPKGNNPAMRELALGGHTGSMIYDFWIGRELNPRFTLPFFGEIDVKTFLEMRPGLTGWLLLNLSFAAKQYRNFGFLSDSMIFVVCLQGYYVLEGLYFEAGILAMMDIATDGLGFMLCFGDLAWVPFLYSTQSRYLSSYPVHTGWVGLSAALAIFCLGLYIFRAANTQKALFRRDPHHPAVKDLSFIQTKRGTKLLTQGWWGAARHVNYLGDWLQAMPFSVPTGIAGYLILPAGSAVAGSAFTMLDGREVAQGAARGWGMVFTYFYVVYFAILLMHREGRDDKACQKKYGKDWDEYKRQVPSKIVPGIY